MNRRTLALFLNLIHNLWQIGKYAIKLPLLAIFPIMIVFNFVLSNLLFLRRRIYCLSIII